MLNKQVSDEWMGQFEVSDNFSIKKKKIDASAKQCLT